MDFSCFKCGQNFINSGDAIHHLKKKHFMIDHVESIKCVFTSCNNTYLTFKGLSEHLKKSKHGTMENVCFRQNLNQPYNAIYNLCTNFYC